MQFAHFGKKRRPLLYLLLPLPRNEQLDNKILFFFLCLYIYKRRVLLKLLSTYVILSLSLISKFPTVKPSGAPSPTRLALTTKQRTRLKRSFLHFDDPWMRSLKVFPPELFFIRNGFRLDLKGASYIYWTRRKYKLSCSMHGFDVFFCLNSTRSLPA